MLLDINIQNIVLINNLSIDFKSGLCVLSGETGSGKSIILDALGLAIGNRSNARLLRFGSKQGCVIARFDISKNKIGQDILIENALLDQENQDIVILKRVLLNNSTSKCFINDIPVSLNLLKKLGDSLIEIHGQNEQKGLLDSSYHCQILDQFAKNQDLLKNLNQKYSELQNIEQKLEELNQTKDRNEREIDYLNHIIKELEAADINIGEEEDLIKRRNFLSSREKIINLISQTQKEVNDSDSSLIFTQKNLINNQSLTENLDSDIAHNINKVIELLDALCAKNDQIKSLIDDIAYSLNDQDSNIEEVEERLFLIRNLSRKFDKTSDDLPNFLIKSQEELNLIQNSQTIFANLENDRLKLQKEYQDIANKISESRKNAALELSKRVESELSYLKMSNVRFLAKVTNKGQDFYGKNGSDDVSFLAAINKNSDFDKINKIASGGELSRFMLALKVALLNVNSVPILIFDEIDSGIGGAVANAVGDRLKLLSNNLQIIVITHHAQVAAKSDHHLQVKKQDVDKVTNTYVTILSDIEKELEVARMLSGEDVSDEAILAAKKLINN